MSEVYNPMYPTLSHLKSKGALIKFDDLRRSGTRGVVSSLGFREVAVVVTGREPRDVDAVVGARDGAA
eukprot:7249-Pyramimonas_sp.AAC.1